MRALRLVIGLIISIHGLYTNEWLFVVVGGFFIYIALMNIGCGGVSNCSTPVSSADNKTEDVTYEEVHK